MAVLPDMDRATVTADLQRDASNINGAAGALSKADLRAAVNAVDQWCDDNAASFNTALPVAARTALTAKQKAALLLYVVERRWLVS